MRSKAGGLVVLLAWAAVSASPARGIWRGRAEIEITVQADKGGVLPGARVTWRFLEVRPVDGPEPVSTDREGKARIFGLAEGRWHVEVLSEGYRSYLASVRVRLGKKVEILSSAMLSEDGSGRGMKISFSRAKKGRAGFPSPPASVSIPQPESAAPIAAEPVPEERPSPPLAEPREPARAAPPAEIPMPAKPPAPEEVRAEAELSLPPSPAPIVVSGPRQKVRARSGRGCPDCRSKELAVTVTASVAALEISGRCPEDLDARVREVLAMAAGEGVDSFMGPLLDGQVRDLASEIGRSRLARVHELLDQVSGSDASCRLMAVVLPKGFRYVGYRYEVSDASGAGDCPPSDTCRVGSSHWKGSPQIVRRGELQAVYGTFFNRSPDRIRRPALTVYFER